MTARNLTVRLNVDRDALRRVVEMLAASARRAEQHVRDFADPPSPERRELRLIARAERAEARLWWEQHRQEGRRG